MSFPGLYTCCCKYIFHDFGTEDSSTANVITGESHQLLLYPMIFLSQFSDTFNEKAVDGVNVHNYRQSEDHWQQYPCKNTGYKCHW